MEFTGVYHKTSEQMSYPLDEDRLIVNIKTGYDVKQVGALIDCSSVARPRFWASPR